MQDYPPQVAQKEPCPECGQLADPVHRAADNNGDPLPQPLLQGWCCSYCGHFMPAIGRERGLDMRAKP